MRGSLSARSGWCSQQWGTNYSERCGYSAVRLSTGRATGSAVTNAVNSGTNTHRNTLQHSSQCVATLIIAHSSTHHSTPDSPAPSRHAQKARAKLIRSIFIEARSNRANCRLVSMYTCCHCSHACDIFKFLIRFRAPPTSLIWFPSSAAACRQVSKPVCSCT